MKKITSWLGGLLVVQLLLATALLWANQAAQQSEPEKLVKIARDSVSSIELSDAESSLLITKEGDAWVMPEQHQLPVAQERVQRLLERLDKLHGTWPVATSQSSHKRFEVAEEKYQRHLRLFEGETLLAELYIGTSPGMGQAHVRNKQQDAVYAVELPVYDLPLEASDWLDKNLLAVAAVSSIKGEKFAVTKQGESWIFAESDAAVDQQKVENLLTALTELRVTSIAKAPQAVDEEVEIQVESRTGNLTYRFTKEAGNAFVKRSDFDVLFKMPSSVFTRVAGVDHETLRGEPLEELATQKQEKTSS